MKTSIKSIHAIKGTLLIKTIFACFVVVAFSFAALPTRAGGAEDEAQKAFDNWVAATEKADKAKKDLDEAKEALAKAQAAMKGDKEKTAAEKELLQNLGNKVAEAEAALKAAEAAVVAARLALEKAIAELPDDSKVKQELKRKRDALDAVSRAARSNSQVVAANGLRVVNFDTVSGRVTVNLPDDMMAGDTISGTVFTEPKGDTPDEKSKNQDQLNGYVIEFEGTKLPASQPRFTWTPPAPQPGAPVRYVLKIVEVLAGNNPPERTIAGAVITPNPKTTPPPHPSGAIITPDPKMTPSFIIPPLGQTGRPIVITGPFDGNSSNTTIIATPLRTSVQDFEKNTENVSGGFGLLAESPRKAVFSSPVNVTGPIQITVNEGNTQTTGSYRNVGVNLTAPKTSLLKGESTELRVQVNGLEGIKTPIPLTIESHGVITMTGGNYQPLIIQPSQVGADGSYSTTRGITGVQAGGWGATATVVTHRFDFCLQDESNPRTVVLVNSFTGNYLFPLPGGTSLTGTGTVTRKGCIITLTDSRPDRRVQGQIDPCTDTGSASVQTFSPRVKFTITDRSTTDNTCAVQ